jgi:hypothetical protein
MVALGMNLHGLFYYSYTHHPLALNSHIEAESLTDKLQRAHLDALSIINVTPLIKNN